MTTATSTMNSRERLEAIAQLLGAATASLENVRDLVQDLESDELVAAVNPKLLEIKASSIEALRVADHGLMLAQGMLEPTKREAA